VVAPLFEENRFKAGYVGANIVDEERVNVE
jgi:hypothetical protein